jgi:hypothetical protein
MSLFIREDLTAGLSHAARALRKLAVTRPAAAAADSAIIVAKRLIGRPAPNRLAGSGQRQ